jgi:DNA adenine methylase
MNKSTTHTRTLMAWPGNKTRLLKVIMPKVRPHVCSCEVFGGSLAWTLAKERSEVEIVNDYNGDLVALWRNAQRHLPELLRQIESVFSSRELFHHYRAQPGFTEIERAARFLIRSKTSFGGGMDSFAVAKTKGGGAAFNRDRVKEQLAAINQRLDKVVVENLPWQRMFKNYDAPTTQWFLDPPYLGADTGAYDGWTEEQMAEFGKQVLKLRGHFIVTVDDSPFNRHLFRSCEIEAVVTKNKRGNQRTNPNSTFGELIITPA